MIKKFVFGMAVLSAMQFTHAATDWTPKLTVLQDSCSNIFHLMDELPKKYKSSIITKSDVELKDGEGGNNITTTYYLKDATAFGLPLDKITEKINDMDMHSMSFSMVFKSTDFMMLRPSFYYKSQTDGLFQYTVTVDNPQSGRYLNEEEEIDVKYKNTALGYEVNDDSGFLLDSGYGYTSLHFDKGSRSIICSQ